LDGIETGVSLLLRDQRGRYLLTDHAVSGVQEAWLSPRLSYGTWDPGWPCQGKRLKRL